MIKSFIKQALRENFFNKLKEVKKEGGEEDTDKEYQELSKDEKKKVNTLTKKVRNATQGPGKLLKLSQVMDAAGVGDANNAADRSKVGKEVSGKPDADGNIRHLPIKAANAMGKVVDNPVAFK